MVSFTFERVFRPLLFDNRKTHRTLAHFDRCVYNSFAVTAAFSHSQSPLLATNLTTHSSILLGCTKKKAIQTTSKLTRFCCCVSAAYRSHLTGKSFPNTSSEVDLQKYNASALWDHSTSLGNLAADSLKYKVRA